MTPLKWFLINVVGFGGGFAIGLYWGWLIWSEDR